MCGILCIFGLHNGIHKALPCALKCTKRLRHRGPDWSGVYAKGKNFMGHERLAIVGSDSDTQPLYNESRTRVLVVNGEIYNHELLRAQTLKKQHVFNTQSDSEVILHLYDEYEERPEEMLNMLNGMFAFVLYDEAKDRFLVARDHMGIIPLYIGWGKDGSVWIASELKALATECARFEEFPPGCYYMSNKGIRVRWYNPSWFDESLIPHTAVDLSLLRSTFEAAVVRRLMANVPFGVLLSGGLDSSLVSSILCRHIAKQSKEDEKGSAIRRVKSFSVGLKESPDLAMARRVAEYLQTEHHEIIFTVEEGLNAISDVIYHLETFDVTTVRASTPMYLMSRRIKANGVKMVLSGEGSDEIFGGYLYFHKAPNAEELHKETIRKLRALHKFDCLRANKSTAAWGVEARVPFLDREFLQYAMSIDPQDKLINKAAGRMEKWILRKAFEGYLPDEVLWRQKEQFSDGVGYSWIDTLKAVAESNVSDAMFAASACRFPDNTPATKEAYYYREIFESHFPQPCAALCVPSGPSIACSTPTAILWDKAFQNAADPSGRAVLGVHNDANKSFVN